MGNPTLRIKMGRLFNSVMKFSVLTLVLSLFSLPALSAEELTWTGCGVTKKAFMAEIAEIYQKKTGTRIKLSGGGATKGIRAVSSGSSDLGGSCRHQISDAGKAINERERGAELVQVAWDALVAVVHEENPVNKISLENLKKVYQGEILSWKELGGGDKRIILCTRGGQGKYSGVGYMFRWLTFDNPEYDFKARSLIFKSTAPLEKKIEVTFSALGITGISSARKRALKVLSLDGIPPTKENIASGKYPLFRPLYIVVNKWDTRPEIKRFLDFILSPEGQAVISRQGTVNLTEGRALALLWEKRLSHR